MRKLRQMRHELAFPGSKDQVQRIRHRGSGSEDQVQIAQIRRLSSGLVPGEAEPGTLPPDGRCYGEQHGAVPTIKDQANTNLQMQIEKTQLYNLLGIESSRVLAHRERRA